MLVSTEKLLEEGFKDRIFKDWNLVTIFPGTNGKRYALLNKAMKKGEVVRLHRGVYMLASRYRQKNFSKFFIANQMVPGSFISFEAALAFHGWIPEKVNLVRSVIPKGRTKCFHTPMGDFEYVKMPINKYEFLNGVSRKEMNDQAFLIATPLRALADYIYFNKVEYKNLSFLQESMRIEKEDLEVLTTNDFKEILLVYTSKRVLSFLQKLKKELRK